MSLASVVGMLRHPSLAVFPVSVVGMFRHPSLAVFPASVVGMLRHLMPCFLVETLEKIVLLAA